MSDVLLTLGHNASVIAVSINPDDGSAVIENAYELERLSGVKSDSRFPIDALVALKERGLESIGRVYVTHWDPMNHVDELKAKYWDRSIFPSGVQVISQEQLGMTHHDCHARAAMVFAGNDFPRHDSGVLVIDGFGNFGEHLSYYRINEDGALLLVKRFFGYYTSLGLMYQYATSFLGMKMHEDEYKLLGYGAHAGDVVPLSDLNEIAVRLGTRVLKEFRSMAPDKMSPMLEELPRVQLAWAKRFEEVLEQAGLVGLDTSSFEARCVIGYVAQQVLQLVVRNLLLTDLRLPANLIVTGGVAFNVELNRMLLGMIPGKLCVMPLAGDQGNSIGLWAAHNSRADLILGDLCWGRRKTSLNGQTEDDHLPEGLFIMDKDGDDVFNLMASQLETTGFVNLVRGNMEFGPRALCNTSTIAVPNRPDVVDEINRINGRDTVMPFAPVVQAELMGKIFPGSDRVHRSDEFMICAMTYAGETGAKVPGAALKTASGLFTGRPQSYKAKYEGDVIARLLEHHGVLINTSFNVHGVPICLDLKDVIHSHQYQYERNPNVRTIVITG